MKHFLKISLLLLLCCAVLSCCCLFTFAEEFSNQANFDYRYNELYDETEPAKDITSDVNDGYSEGYNENYDESTVSDVTSSDYDAETQSYYEDYDERVYEPETVPVIEPNGIKVFLNGKELVFDVNPLIINDRTMVPMRVIFEALGAEVSWNADTRTAIGKTSDTTVKISIGKDYLVKNNNIVLLDSPAVILADRTLVPVRAIAESLDCHVEWYQEAQVVEILK